MQHLLLGAQKTFLEAAAVAHAQGAAGALERAKDRVGILQSKSDRLLDQHRLAHLERRAHRLCVLAFRRGDEDRVHLRPGHDLEVVAGMKIRAGLLGKRAGARRVAVGNREKSHRRMLCRQTRAQTADPPRTHHGYAEFFALLLFSILITSPVMRTIRLLAWLVLLALADIAR